MSEVGAGVRISSSVALGVFDLGLDMNESDFQLTCKVPSRVYGDLVVPVVGASESSLKEYDPYPFRITIDSDEQRAESTIRLRPLARDDNEHPCVDVPFHNPDSRPGELEKTMPAREGFLALRGIVTVVDPFSSRFALAGEVTDSSVKEGLEYDSQKAEDFLDVIRRVATGKLELHRRAVRQAGQCAMSAPAPRAN